MLQTYCGSRVREHLGECGPPHVRPTYGRDQTGTQLYRFNSLGYRGEEFDPDARVTIFVCGCSNAFGTGLGLEETWPSRFRSAYAERHGYARGEVNVLNFSEGAASNDYIARTLITQCSEVKPDVVVAQFSPINRAEGLYRGARALVGKFDVHARLSDGRRQRHADVQVADQRHQHRRRDPVRTRRTDRQCRSVVA